MFKTLAFFIKLMPLPVGLLLGRCLGQLGYFILPKKTRTVYLNLKIGFASKYTHEELKALTLKVYRNMCCNFIEFLSLPKITEQGLTSYVKLIGRAHVDEARLAGRGVICVAVHAGNWELSNVVASASGKNYHIVVNRQSKSPAFDQMLTEFRQLGGANVIVAGEDTKEMIRAIKNKDILTIVIDQGGREGECIPFLGKPASMSTGAIRLALKYDCAVCPVWINRMDKGHVITIAPPLEFIPSGNEDKDVSELLKKAWAVIEPLIQDNPSEYLWFYKVWKYSNRKDVVVLDDGRTGHLRQSQAALNALEEVLKGKQQTLLAHTVMVAYRSVIARRVLNGLGFISRFVPFIRGRWMLAMALDAATMKVLDALTPDAVISCGSANGVVMAIYAEVNRAKTIAILRQGSVALDFFDRVIMPEHDGKLPMAQGKQIRTKAALNLIDKVYLRKQTDGLLSRYSHLKADMRLKIGVMIGGDAKGVVMNPEVIRALMVHLKTISEHYNATILLTTSRRTPASVDQLIERESALLKRMGLCIIANTHNVPEAVGGILGLSDLILVSAESISMVSEAVSASKMTVVFSPMGNFPQNPTNKYEQFVFKMQQQGYVMAADINNIPNAVSMLMTRKIMLKNLDDKQVLVKGLEGLL